MSDFTNGGGVVVDISGLVKPDTLRQVVARVGQYVTAMRYAKKRVTKITLSVDDYSALMKHYRTEAKEHSLPDVVGLRYHEIPIERIGQ